MNAHPHDCACARVDATAGFLAVADDLIAKALAVSEVAQIARAEMRARQLLLNHWRNRADEAAAAVRSRIAGGGTIPAALGAVDRAMGKWEGDVRKSFTGEIERVYKLARKAGHKKANNQTTASLAYQVPNFTEQIESGKEKVVKAKKKRRVARVSPVFDLADERAIADLFDDQMIWIGRHYGKNVRRTIRESVRPSVVQGMNATAAGKKLGEVVAEKLRIVTVPGGFNGSDAKYMEGLAANTMTNARVRGQIRSFSDLEIVTYEIVNPMDGRTTPQCQWMNGKIFRVEQAVTHIETLSGATNPKFVKENHPWLSMKEIQSISRGAGQVSRKDSASLAEAGLPLPPYHFRCRTTVDAHG